MSILLIPITFLWKLCETIYYLIMDKDEKIQTENVGKQKKGQAGRSKSKQNKKDTPSTELCRRFAGSNWLKALAESPPQMVTPTILNGTTESNVKPITKPPRNKSTKYVAMDCEMVGIGPNGQDDMLARVSIVNQIGEVLLDKYVKPREMVIDYRTNVSGIRPRDIENGEQFEKVQNDVVNILKDKILVGHGIHNDLAVLFIKHNTHFIRDTSKYRPLAKLVANGATPSLKRLTKVILGIEIQNGEHNSVEDARCAMQIYNRFSTEWEKYIKKHNHRHHHNSNYHHKSRSGRSRS